MKILKDTIVKPLPTNEVIEKHEKVWRQKSPKSFVDFISTNNGVSLDDAKVTYGNREISVYCR